MRMILKLTAAILLGGCFFVQFIIVERSFQKMKEGSAINIIRQEVLTGNVFEIYSQSPARQSFLLELDEIDGRLLVNARSMDALVVGQRVRMKGKIQFQSHSLKNYNPSFLKLKRIVASLEADSLVVENEYSYTWRYFSYQLRQYLGQYLYQHFSWDSAALLRGVLVGDTSALSFEIKDHFKISGLTHVMAISGANMTMIAGAIFSLLGLVSLKRKIAATVIILSVFTLLVGASAAVVRAYAMAVVSFVGLHLGRPYLAQRSLIAVIVGIYAWDPYIPLYDIGFHLSVAATSALLVVSSFTRKYLGSWSNSFLGQSILITSAATVGTFPLLFHYFGSLSLLAPVINVILAPLLASLSIIGYVLALLVSIPLFGSICALLSDCVLQWLLFLVSFSAESAEVGMIHWQPSLLVTMAIYGFYVAVPALFNGLFSWPWKNFHGDK